MFYYNDMSARRGRAGSGFPVETHPGEQRRTFAEVAYLSMSHNAQS